jgi:hypothetical protein
MEKSFKYKIEIELDDIEKNVTAITFDISRYHKYTHTLTFDSPITEKSAVLEVEKWLSNSASEEYYNPMKKDFGNESFDDYCKYYKSPTKGGLLGSCRFLEEKTNISYNHIKISCGS